MTKVKPCPICEIGKPRMTHFAIPFKFYPDIWMETEDCLYEPKCTYKRIECSNCGATTMLSITVEQAIEDWNEENEKGIRTGIFQYFMDEDLEVDNG